ncbi:MAG: hypothetical protein GYB68_17075 [Chloroflexi bacterium]|nr:hypothetical protein [Chloroflexota bacterium]
MPVTSAWYDKSRRMILCELIDPWTAQESAVNMATIADLMDEVDYKVPLVIDMTNGTLPFGTLRELPQIGSMRHTNHPNNGGTIIIGAQGFTARVADIFSRVFSRIDFVDTMDDALAVAARKYPVT